MQLDMVKYYSCVKNFSARAHPGGAASQNVNLGPP